MPVCLMNSSMLSSFTCQHPTEIKFGTLDGFPNIRLTICFSFHVSIVCLPSTCPSGHIPPEKKTILDKAVNQFNIELWDPGLSRWSVIGLWLWQDLSKEFFEDLHGHLGCHRLRMCCHPPSYSFPSPLVLLPSPAMQSFRHIFYCSSSTVGWPLLSSSKHDRSDCIDCGRWEPSRGWETTATELRWDVSWANLDQVVLFVANTCLEGLSST